MTTPEDAPLQDPPPATPTDAVRRCHRCTLPVDPAIVHGHLSVDPSGLCDYCRTFDERFSPASAPLQPRERLDAEIRRAMRRARGRSFDALVAISGGKDSLAVLHYLRTHYPDLRILAVTCDNGFHWEPAMEACVRVTRDLGVEHRVWRPPHMIELTRLFLERTGHVCCPCEVSMLNMMHRVTAEEGIPLVVLGTSRKYDGAQPEAANPWTPPFFDAVVRRTPGAQALRKDACDPGLLFRFGARVLTGRVRTLLLPDCVDWNAESNRARLAERYGIEVGPEHADCLAHPVADWLYKRRCGYGQKAASLAAAVRNGLVPRDEALARLAGMDEFGAIFPEKAAEGFLQRIGMTAEEVVACSPVRPQAYFDTTFRLVGMARELLGFSVA